MLLSNQDLKVHFTKSRVTSLTTNTKKNNEHDLYVCDTLIYLCDPPGFCRAAAGGPDESDPDGPGHHRLSAAQETQVTTTTSQVP